MKKDKPSEYVNENSTLQLVSIFYTACCCTRRGNGKGLKNLYLLFILNIGKIGHLINRYTGNRVYSYLKVCTITH